MDKAKVVKPWDEKNFTKILEEARSAQSVKIYD